MRTSRTSVTFAHPFSLQGAPGTFPGGTYEVVIEEEQLQGLSFEAWRRTATFLTVHGKGGHARRSEWREISETDLDAALSRDRAFSDASEAALPPQENF
ncbi:hypothetical protein [Pseudooceanicola spongiae]|uniref:Uncharacterized protein n=1 Tax=Pseudooceanicola spongiae TaxID=2613965 RepID=A0A7L9WMH8_9RHOB|nr:hypothetical protein [Pseudooceanicola spongiae]QOL81132.1 hypothetical protein F3W81_10110 [Pseudooceanicola spongiae]